MDGQQVNAEISALVDAWCERRQLDALAGLLAAWLANNGLTDGWMDLAAALRSGAGNHSLPAAERETLQRLYVTIDHACRSR